MKTAMVENINPESSTGPLGWWARGKDFLAKVREEMSRVTWPSQREVQATTVVVIVFSALMGLYLFAVDAAFNRLIEFIFTRLGGVA